ncbi:MAG: hypothetical protein QM796_18525 [Chthoniobacteraceae bacterium]
MNNKAPESGKIPSGLTSAEDHSKETQTLPQKLEFDLGQFRIDQSFAENQTTKELTTCPVGKPPKNSYFRADSRPESRAEVPIIEHEGVYHLVAADVAKQVADPALSVQTLIVCVTKDGTPFLNALKAPTNSWAISAHRAVATAKTIWIRLSSSKELGAYEVIRAASQTQEPAWPSQSFAELVQLAFRDRVITSLDHPVLAALRGE